MKGKYILPAVLITLTLLGMLACHSNTVTSNTGKKSIVVTYSILGSVVKELVGDEAKVTVSIPNGLDPHEWEPSAKDIEAINKADLVIQNGLGLEGGLEKTLAKAKSSGVKFFTASDYITIRHVGSGEGIPSGDPDQAAGAEDPHLWTDPLAMKEIVSALASQLKSNLGIDVDARAQDLEARLDALNGEISDEVATLPQDNRKLVTGHESMGYFSQRYGFKLVGAIIPGTSTQAEVSAADLAELKKLIEENRVKAIFAELGTSSAVAKSIGEETGTKIVKLATHTMPDDGSYFTFERNLAKTIIDALK
ncbi:MAG: metal ABC transporter substrate-binding protein [Dehalococcoidia bacterium]